eukprot:7249074-Pyramimonas_sp.AAC.1
MGAVQPKRRYYRGWDILRSAAGDPNADVIEPCSWHRSRYVRGANQLGHRRVHNRFGHAAGVAWPSKDRAVGV